MNWDVLVETIERGVKLRIFSPDSESRDGNGSFHRLVYLEFLETNEYTLKDKYFFSMKETVY